MQEQMDQNEHDRTLIINIDLTRGVMTWIAVAVIAAAVMGLLAWGGVRPTAAGEQQTALATSSNGMRQYYLSKSYRTGAEALSACAEGFHMASLWEILDPSNLEYNADLGRVKADSGSGPPAYENGWVRTGSDSFSDNELQGRANCDAWTTTDGYGTLAWLPRDWADDLAELHVWTAGWTSCGALMSAWCVED